MRTEFNGMAEPAVHAVRACNLTLLLKQCRESYVSHIGNLGTFARRGTRI